MISRVLFAVFFGLLISCNHKRNETKNPEDNNYLTISENEIDKIKVCTEMSANPTDIKVVRKQASGKRWLFWEKSKKTLYVSFMDGDPVVQEKVKSVAKEWENYCGKELKFIKPDEGDADITISFSGKDSWSLVGKDSKSKRPSMNLGWLTVNTSDEEYRRVVLHEFGHALGLVHEHQNPNNVINWNKEYVYAFYKQKFGWTKQVTYYNFFEKYSKEQMNSSSFDPTSIMMYEIPEKFTTDGFHTMSNTQLSETDKTYFDKIYPKDN